MTEKVLLEKKFSNGIKVCFYDLSKKVAADRWMVKINCEALFEPGKDAFDAIEDENLVHGLKDKFARGVTHTISKERNFIDEQDKDAILVELLTQLQDNVFLYLGSDRFPQSLLQKKIDDFQKEFELTQKMGAVVAVQDEEEEGPADFSACFRD
ncbi:MAG: hypothetical protein V1706_13290 [Pseudomonadota bacterium]